MSNNEYSVELGNVSKACKVMGFSRDTFYRYQKLTQEGGVDALINRSSQLTASIASAMNCVRSVYLFWRWRSFYLVKARC